MSKTPVFLLVGHGSVSAKKTIIDVGNYNVILPVKIGCQHRLKTDTDFLYPPVKN